MSDNLHGSLLKRMQARWSADRLAMPMSEWIEANTTLAKKPFSFANYPFQRAIADDMHPDLACKKCSQVGLTEIQIRKALGFLKRNQGTSLGFTLPDIKLYNVVAQSRILPLLKNDPVFNMDDDIGSVRSKPISQIGHSWLHVFSGSESDATSTPLDVLVHDELDLSDQSIIALFQSRLNNSAWKVTQRFSTPTFTGFGIDQAYQVSDQREYFCRCSACNHWQVPSFERKFLSLPGLTAETESFVDLTREQIEAIDINNAYVKCERCHSRLDLLGQREWVALFPERHLVRGYNVRPFCTDRLHPVYILTRMLYYRERDFIRGWYNTVLGEPYTDGNVRLTEEAIAGNMKGSGSLQVSRDVPVRVGIDLGNPCHLVLGAETPEGLTAFHFETVSGIDLEHRVGQLETQYRIVSGAVDRLPYTPDAERVRNLTNRRIVPVQYTGSKGVELKMDEFENLDHVQADRTALLDNTANLIRAGKLPMHGYGAHGSILIEHLRDMVRDESPEKPAVWKKLTGNDHYFHALALMVYSQRVQAVIADRQEFVGDQVGAMAVSVPLQSPSDIYRQGRRQLPIGFDRFQ